MAIVNECMRSTSLILCTSSNADAAESACRGKRSEDRMMLALSEASIGYSQPLHITSMSIIHSDRCSCVLNHVLFHCRFQLEDE